MPLSFTGASTYISRSIATNAFGTVIVYGISTDSLISLNSGVSFSQLDGANVRSGTLARSTTISTDGRVIAKILNNDNGGQYGLSIFIYNGTGYTRYDKYRTTAGGAQILPDSVCISGDGLTGWVWYLISGSRYLYKFSVNPDTSSITYNDNTTFVQAFSAVTRVATTYTGNSLYYIASNFAYKYSNGYLSGPLTGDAVCVHVTLDNRYVIFGLNMSPIKLYLSSDYGESFSLKTTDVTMSANTLIDIFISIDGNKIYILTWDYFYEVDPYTYRYTSRTFRTTTNSATTRFLDFSVSMNGLHAICAGTTGYMITTKSTIATNFTMGINKLDLTHYFVKSPTTPNDSTIDTNYYVNGQNLSQYLQYMDASYNPVMVPYRRNNTSICKYFLTY